MKIIREQYEIEKRETGTLLLTFRDKIKVELDHAIQIDKDCTALIQKNNFDLIIEARNINSYMTGEALNYLAKEAITRNQVKKCGMLINSLPIRLIAKFYIRYSKPPYPIKIYKHKSELIAWFDEVNNYNHTPNQTQI